MALFETVKDIMFAEIMETTLTEISKELLRANELKEKELALKSKELELLNSEEFKYNHIERYKRAFLDACNRLEELDGLLYEMDQTGRCERNGCIFNRDHAINVYTGGSGTDYFMEHYPSEVAGLCSNYSYIYPFGNAGIRICNRLDAEGRKERRG